MNLGMSKKKKPLHDDLVDERASLSMSMGDHQPKLLPHTHADVRLLVKSNVKLRGCQYLMKTFTQDE